MVEKEKEDEADPKLVDLGAKSGCLEFHIKAGLDRIPVVAPLTMMMIFMSVLLTEAMSSTGGFLVAFFLENEAGFFFSAMAFISGVLVAIILLPFFLNFPRISSGAKKT